eukprot:3588623-Prymnesium_polylepis.1
MGASSSMQKSFHGYSRNDLIETKRTSSQSHAAVRGPHANTITGVVVVGAGAAGSSRALRMPR